MNREVVFSAAGIFFSLFFLMLLKPLDAKTPPFKNLDQPRLIETAMQRWFDVADAIIEGGFKPDIIVGAVLAFKHSEWLLTPQGYWRGAMGFLLFAIAFRLMEDRAVAPLPR